MPLPASGPISLDDIRVEFAGSNPVRLSDYYRGGSLVPNTPANNAIPTSGIITLADFYGGGGGGGGGGNVNLSNKSVEDTRFSGTAYAGVRLSADGKFRTSTNNTTWVETSPLNEWLDPEDDIAASNYEARATGVQGSVTPYSHTAYENVTPETWTRLGNGTGGRGQRQFWVSRADHFGQGMNYCTFTIEIRAVGTTTVLATCTVYLSAEIGAIN